METEAAIIEMTKLVRGFALGAVDARAFIEKYSNFYYYEALDGHEDSSALLPGSMMMLGPAIELHRRVQEDVVNRISFDAGLSAEAMRMAGRLSPAEARERALTICADVGIEAVLLTEEAMSGQRSENFEAWRPEGMNGSCAWNVGEVRYLIDGSLAVDLFNSAGQRAWGLVFETPLTVRITQAGSLQEYWESGLVVRGHNLMRATRSSLLTWLENSSGGVHVSGQMVHYAVFSDDACVEVISRVAPSLVPSSP
ncbi:hypothetical protein ACK1O1_05865 [Stenotrophomonas maltophilia]|uniref:hypothetical protein n=1 Tax=Stenotrophomonas maltophilia TaxID=40324 RepID=UPI0039171090